MIRYALIGKRLGHSWSQRWFEAQFRQLGLKDHCYELHEMERLDDLRQWVERKGIAGFNVTVPYKQAILPLLDGLDAEAAAIGAVNCVSVERGRLLGHNTDAPAFRETLLDSGFTIQHSLILGTGGAARAVAYALRQLGVEPLFVSRHPQGEGQVGYEALADSPLKPNTLIVNATPVGMYPDVNAAPIDMSEIGGRTADGGRRQRPADDLMVYDLIYNPSPTRLLRDAAAHGARTVDGLAMLERQAELSLDLWERRE